MVSSFQSTLDFYRICAQIVQSWPATYKGDAELPCHRLNAFGQVYTWDELDSDNLGKGDIYKSKDFFFNRNGNGNPIAYPALLIAEDGIDMASPWDSGQDVERTNLLFVDQKPGKYSSCPDGNYCRERTVEEAGWDLRQLAHKFFRYLAEWGEHEVTALDASVSTYWESSLRLQAQLDAGEIAGYAKKAEMVHFFTSPSVSGEIIYGRYNDNLIVMPLSFEYAYDLCEPVDDPLPLQYGDRDCDSC